jgi:ATP/maltotriose-dependent transcriptional regulator MalT
LINALAVAGRAALVLDDFHRLSIGPARESIAAFVDGAPASFQLVLACRSEPGLPLAAMRAHGTLLEVRAEELGFTCDEASSLLNDRLELGLEREYIDDLVARTEGWAAGLYLAALSLGGAEDRNAFVSTFGGASRHVLDFLVDEVLEAHEPEAQELMLRSSVLERLSGPLCDAVLERRDSATLLDALSRTNLFLVPLDDRGEWYRFHHLFAQLLRVELEHRSPGLAPALHRRAFEWHHGHGLADAAISHALEAGAFDEARDMIAGIRMQTLPVGRQATVIAWLDRFPRELVRNDPVLLLVKARTFALTGRLEEALAELAVLEGLSWPDDQPLPNGSTSLEASVVSIRAAIDSCRDPGVLPGKLAELTRARARDRPRDLELSARELGVLRMLSGPLSERDIGRELYLSHNTVHSHTKSIYKKLGVSSRSKALERARELELL